MLMQNLPFYNRTVAKIITFCSQPRVRSLVVTLILAEAEWFVKTGCQAWWLLGIRGIARKGLWFLWKRLGNSCGNLAAPVCYNGNMAYIRKFKTTSGATGVQVCYKEQGRVVRTVHVGSASSEVALERLMREAQGIIDGDKKPLFNLDKFNKK